MLADRSGVVDTIAFGHANGVDPVKATDLFEIGSISKFFTALMIGQLVDDGVMAFDDSAVAHLPWLRLGRDRGATSAVTIEHLLTHSAGLVCGIDGLPDDIGQVWALRDTQVREPGERFHYSNVGYNLLGLIIAERSGRPHPDQLRSRIFDPLGIGSGLTAVRNRDRSRIAVGYAPSCDDRPWLPGDPVAPATWIEAIGADGNVALDADGMGVLLRLLLGDGSIDGTRVMSRETFARITRGSAPGGESVPDWCAVRPVTSSRYGYGINVETIDGATCLTHGGGMIGFASFVLADRDRDCAVGVMTNANGDCLAAQLLARYAHGLMTSSAASPLPAEWLDPRARARADMPPELRGTDRSGHEVSLEIDGAGRVTALGHRGLLYRDLYGRWSTDHPLLRMAYLHHPVGHIAESQPVSRRDAVSIVGRYRSNDPWFTTFRIVDRAGRLFLTAAGGVEAPTDDEELVPIAPRVYRRGRDPWVPESLTVVAEVAERAVVLDVGHCEYTLVDRFPG